jgi:ABC-type transport system involved in multi-copper enzyme maturation permease subunit
LGIADFGLNGRCIPQSAIHNPKSAISYQNPMSLSRVLAIAHLTALESKRKRVFLALAGFGAALVVMTALFPAIDPASQILLLQAWSCRLILLFGMLVAIVLASFSVPEDIEERRIQTLLAKPVRRIEVMVGKYLGFLGVMAVFFAAMGLFSLATLRGVAVLTGAGASPVMTPDTAVRASAYAAAPDAKPWRPSGRIDRFDRIAGPLDRAHEWTFKGVTRERHGDRFRLRARVFLGVQHDDPGHVEDTVPVRIEVEDPARPGTGLAAVHVFWYGRTDVIDLPSSAAGADGRMVVRLRRMREDAWVAAGAASLELLHEGGPLAFDWNYAKSLLLILTQVAVVMSLTLAVSLFTSALVSMLAGGFFVLCGNMVGFLREALITSQAVAAEMASGKARRPDPDDVPAWMLRAANWITEQVLTYFPDLSKLDYSGYLMSHTSVPLDVVFGPRETLMTGLYLILPLAGACLIAAKKEFH